MTIFQIVAISALVLLSVVTIIFQRTNVIGKGGGLFWVMIFSAAAIAIAAPSTTIQVARFLGIGRGADLVLYLAILSGMAAFFLTHARMRRMEADLTMLVRQIALQESQRVTSATDSPRGE